MSHRKLVMVFIDEWPVFAASSENSLTTILEQCRKFGFFLTLAAQSYAQVPTKRLSAALENCRQQIIFGVHKDTARIVADMFSAISPLAILAAKQQGITGLEALGAADQERQLLFELVNMPAQTVYVRRHPEPPIKVKTLTVPPVHDIDITPILANYAQRYQRPAAPNDEEPPTGLPSEPDPQPPPLPFKRVFRPVADDEHAAADA